AIYRTEVYTEVCAGAIYPNKVVSEPGYDKQWQKTALGAMRLSLAKNVACNIVNEKTTYGLFKALSNMYEKPSASNKVFLIRQLVNTKMNEGASVEDHVNEFNSIISRLMSVDIKFDDDVQALLLLSSLPESWSCTVTAVSGLTGKDKGRGRKQDRGQKHNRSRSKSKKRGQSKNRQDITSWNCNQKVHFRNQCSKPVTSRDKEVNMAAREYDDALVCCVKNTIDDRIIDSGASFHTTYCKEELERFKLRSGKVHLVDDKTLDIAGVGDVVLKTSFGTSWTLKDVRDQQWKVTKGSLVVTRGNKRGSLYLVEVPSDGINAAINGRGNTTLWHQRLGHMSEKGMKILGSKGRILDLQKAIVGFCKPCVLGKQKKVSFVKSGNTKKLQSLELIHTDVYVPTSVASIGGSRYYVTFIEDNSRKVWVYFLKNKSEVFNTFKKWKAAVENETNLQNGIRMLKTVLETPQQNGVAERINRTLNKRAKKEEWQGKEVSLAHLRVFGCDSYVKVKDVARDKLDAKSVKCTFIGYGSDEMGYRFWDSKSHKVVRIRDVTFNEDSLYGAKDATDSSNLTKLNMKDQVVLEDSPGNLANKSIVSEHGLRPGGSSDMGEGSENSRSFKDSGRSDEEDSKDKASFEEGGSETPQLRRSIRESRALVRYSPSANYLLLIENGEPESYSEALRKKALQSKWVFMVKEEQDGKKKYKAILVVKGFQQKQGVDYNEIFSPVVKMTKIRHLHDTTRGFSVSWERRKPRVQVEEKSVQIKASTETMKVGSSSIILLLYVDDMLVAGSDMAEIKKLKRQLSKEFKKKDLGPAKCQPLGDHFKISKIQAPKTEASRRKIAKVPYASAVGSIMYTMLSSGCYATGKGTSKATLCFSRKEVVLEGFSDSDYEEAEYIAIAEAGKELVWLKNFLEELDIAQIEYRLFCDNQSAIHLAKNSVFHGRTKHIKIRYHYIRELVSEGTLFWKKILGAKNPADMLTKVVVTEKLKLCAASTDLRDN
ncbi:putative RNA-directed DNA polymerase, partial [Tanacetum coccineum]